MRSRLLLSLMMVVDIPNISWRNQKCLYSVPFFLDANSNTFCLFLSLSG